MAELSLVLASGSPRREVLLRGLGLDFTIRSADVDESPLTGESAATMATRLAIAKASAAAQAGEVVLAADTVVTIDGDVLGKPVDDADAARMLRRLSGRTHVVTTGLAVLVTGEPHREASATVDTEVTFVAIPEPELEWYVATGEPLDKAGAYGLQGVGARFVRSIVGSPTNVVGLPLAELVELASSVDVDLARYRRPS